eukprot:UC1_evm1s2075
MSPSSLDIEETEVDGIVIGEAAEPMFVLTNRHSSPDLALATTATTTHNDTVPIKSEKKRPRSTFEPTVQPAKKPRQPGRTKAAKTKAGPKSGAAANSTTTTITTTSASAAIKKASASERQKKLREGRKQAASAEKRYKAARTKAREVGRRLQAVPTVISTTAGAGSSGADQLKSRRVVTSGKHETLSSQIERCLYVPANVRGTRALMRAVVVDQNEKSGHFTMETETGTQLTMTMEEISRFCNVRAGYVLEYCPLGLDRSCSGDGGSGGEAAATTDVKRAQVLEVETSERTTGQVVCLIDGMAESQTLSVTDLRLRFPRDPHGPPPMVETPEGNAMLECAYHAAMTATLQRTALLKKRNEERLAAQNAAAARGGKQRAAATKRKAEEAAGAGAGAGAAAKRAAKNVKAKKVKANLKARANNVKAKGNTAATMANAPHGAGATSDAADAGGASVGQVQATAAAAAAAAAAEGTGAVEEEPPKLKVPRGYDWGNRLEVLPVGTLLWYRYRSYPFWPCRAIKAGIIEVRGKVRPKITVQFFGDNACEVVRGPFRLTLRPFRCEEYDKMVTDGTAHPYGGTDFKAAVQEAVAADVPSTL